MRVLPDTLPCLPKIMVVYLYVQKKPYKSPLTNREVWKFILNNFLNLFLSKLFGIPNFSQLLICRMIMLVRIPGTIQTRHCKFPSLGLSSKKYKYNGTRTEQLGHDYNFKMPLIQTSCFIWIHCIEEIFWTVGLL